MAFYYRKSIDGDAVQPCKDYPLETTYALTAKAGDVVRLNGTGNLILALTGDTTVLGVLDGVNFVGLNKTPTKGKVRISPDALYEAEFVGAGALTIGTAYGIDGASRMDTADTTVLIVKIIEVVNGKPLVGFTARQLV